jgi:uncharacterized protein (TIGR03492 family)
LPNYYPATRFALSRISPQLAANSAGCWRPVIGRFPDYKLEFLAAIAPSLPLESFTAALISQGWREHSTNKFICQEVFITISQRDYAEYLGRCHLAIAMAGTATEQFVGLGKPAITIAVDPQIYSPFCQTATAFIRLFNSLRR